VKAFQGSVEAGGAVTMTRYLHARLESIVCGVSIVASCGGVVVGSSGVVDSSSILSGDAISSGVVTVTLRWVFLAFFFLACTSVYGLSSCSWLLLVLTGASIAGIFLANFSSESSSESELGVLEMSIILGLGGCFVTSSLSLSCASSSSFSLSSSVSVYSLICSFLGFFIFSFYTFVVLVLRRSRYLQRLRVLQFRLDRRAPICVWFRRPGSLSRSS
jgi:hypothetical protein